MGNMGNMEKIEKRSVSYNKREYSMNPTKNTSEPMRGGNKTTQNSSNFITEIAKKYPRDCAYYIHFGDCTNKDCFRLHNNRNRASYQEEMQKKNDLAREEMAKGRSSYCVYFKHGCCNNSNCKKSHHIPDEEHVSVSRPVYVPEFVAAGGCESVSRKYLDSALKPKEQTNSRQVVKASGGSSSYTENFKGSDLQSRFNICNKTSCSCNKSHNMQNQTRNITNKRFDKFMKDNKLPLAELLLKLNAVYCNQLEQIISVIENRPEHFEHEYFGLPNGGNSITELVKIFNLIENGDWKQVSLIYSGHLSQLDYSLLYETFRRSKQCSHNMNGRFCHYGVNCKKGHHGTDAICYNDLFTGSCNCNPNASDKIVELQDEINKLKASDSEDGFTVISKERQTHIKRLSEQIQTLKSQQIVHLHRDKLVTNKITQVVQNFSANDFTMSLPEVSEFHFHTELALHENLHALRLQRQKEMNELHLATLSNISSPEDYNLLVRGKQLMIDSEGNPVKKQKTRFSYGVGNNIDSFVWEKTDLFLPNGNGFFGVPLCYIGQSIGLNDSNISSDFSKEHGWTPELWAEYLSATFTEGRNKINFWLDHTFKSYVSFKSTVLPLYLHSMNKHLDWSRFMAIYNRKLVEWDLIFTDTEFSSDDDCNCVYSLSSMIIDYSKVAQQNELLKEYLDHIAFILDIKLMDDERVTGKLNSTHSNIINESPKIFDEFFTIYKTNSKLQFASWIESVYRNEYLMKLEKKEANFNDIIMYVKKQLSIDLDTYLINPAVANEWHREIVPKVDISFEDYLGNRTNLYKYYSTNYYLTGNSIDEMIAFASQGWQYNNTSKVTMFVSLLVLSIGQLKTHRQTINKSISKLINPTDLMSIKNLGCVTYSPFNVQVIGIINEMVKPDANVDLIVKLFNKLSESYSKSVIDIDFESYEFVVSFRQWLENKLVKTPEKQVKVRVNKRKLLKQDSDSDSDSDSESDSESDSDDSDSDFEPDFGFGYKPENDLIKIPAKKQTATYDLDFTKVVFGGDQQVFICRNTQADGKAGYKAGNPILIGPITNQQFNKFKIETKKLGLPLRLIKFKTFNVASLPLKSQTSISFDLNAVIIRVFELEDSHQIKNMTKLELVSEEEDEEIDVSDEEDGFDFDRDSKSQSVLVVEEDDEEEDDDSEEEDEEDDEEEEDKARYNVEFEYSKGGSARNNKNFKKSATNAKDTKGGKSNKGRNIDMDF